MLTKNYITFVVCLSALSGQILGAASSSSSSSSSTSTLRQPTHKVSLTQTIAAALSFTEGGAIPGLAQLIMQYTLGGSINVATDVQKWITNGPQKQKIPCDISEKFKHLKPHFPVASLEPAFHCGLQPGTDEDLNDFENNFLSTNHHLFVPMSRTPTGIKVCVFNNKNHRFAQYWDMVKQCYLIYRWNPTTKTLQFNLKDSYPLGKPNLSADDADLSLAFHGDISLEVSPEIPETTLQISDGSTVYVWVDDHNPLTGGSTLTWYVIDPIRTMPIPAS